MERLAMALSSSAASGVRGLDDDFRLVAVASSIVSRAMGVWSCAGGGVVSGRFLDRRPVIFAAASVLRPVPAGLPAAPETSPSHFQHEHTTLQRSDETNVPDIESLLIVRPDHV